MRIVLSVLLTTSLVLSAFAQQPKVDEKSKKTTTVKVFLSNIKKDPDVMDCTLVFPVERKIAKTDDVFTAALNELFKGSTKVEEKLGYYTLSAEQTKGILKSVKVKDGAAYVDFSDVVYKQMRNVTSSCGSGYFAAVEATLKQFPEVKKVYYSVEGKHEDFYDWLGFECPEDLKNCALDGS